MSKGDHTWRDDALRPDGRAWMAGIRFVCENGCGVERRVVGTGRDGGNPMNVYFRGTERTERLTGVPTCSPQ